MAKQMTTPENAVLQVTDRASFIRFLDALARDRAEADYRDGKSPPPPFSAGALGWENGTIAAFLEAASAAARDDPGDVPENPWRACADILLAGKYYE